MYGLQPQGECGSRLAAAAGPPGAGPTAAARGPAVPPLSHSPGRGIELYDF